MRAIKIAIGVVALLALGLCVAVNIGNAPNKTELDRVNRESAETLVAALRTFKQGHEVYPTELGELVPDLLPALPTVQPAGGSFEYAVRPDGADFTLGYPEAPLGTLPADAGFEYSASAGEWKHVTY